MVTRTTAQRQPPVLSLLKVHIRETNLSHEIVLGHLIIIPNANDQLVRGLHLMAANDKLDDGEMNLADTHETRTTQTQRPSLDFECCFDNQSGSADHAAPLHNKDRKRTDRASPS